MTSEQFKIAQSIRDRIDELKGIIIPQMAIINNMDAYKPEIKEDTTKLKMVLVTQVYRPYEQLKSDKFRDEVRKAIDNEINRLEEEFKKL